MENTLNNIIEKNLKYAKEGRVADYIPALGKADPNDIGIAIVDINGKVYCRGDYKKKFTIQSISKIISLAIALEDNGEEYVFSKVGTEGTEQAFNSLFEYKPPNPMINAGAILTTSLIKGDRLSKLIHTTGKIVGRKDVDYSEEVYISEKETGNKNKAIGYLLKNLDLLNGQPEEILDIYFKQCSIEVNALDLAKIGYLFANKGTSWDGKKVFSDRIGQIVLAIMQTAGMYNYSGRYAIDVGIPSKSGVSGGIVASLPNKLGIGVYSPSLDENGNPLLGLKILEDLSKEFNYSIF